MALPPPSSPRALWADLRLFWQGRTRTQWGAATLAVLIPIVIAILFYLDGRTNIAPGPQVIFVESWPAERTDAQIRAKQAVDLRARQARERARQQEFQQLDNSLTRLGL
jgi:hypothetical protein